MKHTLKIRKQFFMAVATGVKPFEVRRADRNYQVGDTLEFCEFDDGGYTGAAATKRITYVLFGWGLHEGFLVLGLAPHEQPGITELQKALMTPEQRAAHEAEEQRRREFFRDLGHR